MPASPTADLPDLTGPTLRLRGLRAGNLQGIDLDLPLQSVICIAGVAGSGKSSLAFETIYAEGQRRFLETLSPTVRQSLQQYDRPEADEIGALPPTISVRRPPRRRSVSVAQWSEVGEAIGEFFCQSGTIVCPECGCDVRRQTPADAVEQVGRLPEGTRLLVGFRLRRAVTDIEQPIGNWLRQSGFRRLLLGETLVDIESTQPEVLQLLTARPGEIPTKISSATAGPAVELLVIVDRLVAGRGENDRLLDSLETACRQAMQEVVVLAETSTDGAVGVTRLVDGREFERRVFSDELRCPQCDREFPRPEPALLRNGSDDDSGLSEALQIEGRRIVDVMSMTARDAVQWLDSLGESLRVETDGVGEPDGSRSNPLHAAAGELLALLCETGLADLRLDADVGELSIGENSLLMLATARAAGVVHSLFVVETPAAGLASGGIDQAAAAVRALQLAGNTVLVVESSPEFLEHADWIVELGPGSGRFGGQLIDQGTPAEVLPRMRQRWEDERQRRPVGSRTQDRRPTDHATVALPAQWHLNPKDGSPEISLQCLTVLTGGHGCGAESWFAEKFFTSLVETLTAINDVEGQSLPCDAVMLVDSGAVSGSRRSTVVTHLKVFGEIRQVFAETRDARVRNLSARDFSFNAASGRCPACRGLGTVRIDMHFLPDMSMPCPECHGTRYRPEILEVHFRGLSIADVLRLTADEAFPLFRGQRSLQKKIGVLRELGLGALPVGQPTADLTACDVQRLRLAAAVGTGTSARTAFLLIDPSAGLHPLDVDRLLTALDRVLERGHTVLVLDRSPQLMAAADRVIQLD